MANAVTNITSQFTAPYLTVAEFKNAPTSIDLNALVIGGNTNSQDAELANVINRASSWIDQQCNQILGATQNTEQQRSRVKNDGTIRVHPKYFPVVELTAFSYGSALGSTTSVTDCSTAWIEEQEIIVPYSLLATSYSNQGPLQFGFPTTPGREVFCKYTYINGYANTTIVSAVAAASTLTVGNALGIVPNQMLSVYDGVNSENVTVAASYSPGSTTIPLAAPLVSTHAAGTAISALPAAVKEAAILSTTAFLKVRGDASMTMQLTNTANRTSGSRLGNELDIAVELLKPFRRIR